MYSSLKKLNILKKACLLLSLLALASFAESASMETAASIQFLKQVEVGPGARPEIVAAKDRVFVVYLDTAKKGNPSFSVKIFDKDMNKEISHTILVSSSPDYGRPTDIRVASDGTYMYAFYETLVMGEKAYLWGASYVMDDRFNKTASTSKPIASGPMFTRENPGDEIVNDPIPLIGTDSVFVITRIKQRSFSKEESMVYRVREYSRDLQTKMNEFDLDLSSMAHGEGRQASALHHNGHYYMAVPSTTKSGNYSLDMITPSDVLLIAFDNKWKIMESRFLSQEPDDVETFVTGFKARNDHFYLTYKQGRKEASGWSFVSPLKVFDRNGKLVFSTVVKRATGKGESLRSALEVTGDRIYVGHSAGQGPPPPTARGMRPGEGDFRRERHAAGRGRPAPVGQNRLPEKREAFKNIESQRAEVYIYKY